MRNDGTKMQIQRYEKSMRKVQESQKINIRTIDDPKCLNIGTTCSEEETLQYIHLFK